MLVRSDEGTRSILEIGPVAVVGWSGTPRKDAPRIPRYLLATGYDLVPVNPYRKTLCDRTAVDTLARIDPPVGLVNVFRPSDEVGHRRSGPRAARRRGDLDTAGHPR